MVVLNLYCISHMSHMHLLGLIVSESPDKAMLKFCNIVGFQTIQDYTDAWSYGMRKIMIEQSNINNIIKYSISARCIQNFTKLETLARHYNKDYVILPSLEELKQCVGFKSIAKYKLKKYCL